jgi:hypothetical protein
MIGCPDLLISDRHLVHGNVVGHSRTVAIELDRVRELVYGPGEGRIVGNIDRDSHAINRQRVMDYGMGGRCDIQQQCGARCRE